MSSVPRISTADHIRRTRGVEPTPQTTYLARVVADWADPAGPVTPADESPAKYILQRYAEVKG